MCVQGQKKASNTIQWKGHYAYLSSSLFFDRAPIDGERKRMECAQRTGNLVLFDYFGAKDAKTVAKICISSISNS